MFVLKVQPSPAEPSFKLSGVFLPELVGLCREWRGLHITRECLWQGCRKGGAKHAAEKLVQAVILSSSEGSGFEFSNDYRFFVACWLLRMTVLGRFSAACKAPPVQSRGEKSKPNVIAAENF